MRACPHGAGVKGKAVAGLAAYKHAVQIPLIRVKGLGDAYDKGGIGGPGNRRRNLAQGDGFISGSGKGDGDGEIGIRRLGRRGVRVVAHQAEADIVIFSLYERANPGREPVTVSGICGGIFPVAAA